MEKALDHSLQFPQGRPATAAVFGAIGGPMAHTGASRPGAVTSNAASTTPTQALGIAWDVAVRFPCELARLTRRAGPSPSTESTP